MASTWPPWQCVNTRGVLAVSSHSFMEEENMTLVSLMGPLMVAPGAALQWMEMASMLKDHPKLVQQTVQRMIALLDSESI